MTTTEPGRPAVTIRHTRAAGTLIEGSSRGDGVYEVLKSLRTSWRYFPSLRQIGLGQSRDRAAKRWRIEQAAGALRAAGYPVTVDIDDGPGRDFAEAEADRYERAEARADYHGEHAGRAAAASNAAAAAAHGILDVIPMGQPILVGHHSEARHRRDLARADAAMHRARNEEERGEYHEDRARAAATYQARRESIPTTLRRIKALEARERDLLRGINDHRAGRHPYIREVPPATGARLERLTAELAEVKGQLTYWRVHVEQAKAAGAKVWDPADFTRGDFVRFLGSWYEVQRVNGKSLTIPAMINHGYIVRKAGARCTWNDTIPYDKVTGRKTAAEVAELLAEAQRREAAASA